MLCYTNNVNDKKLFSLSQNWNTALGPWVCDGMDNWLYNQLYSSVACFELDHGASTKTPIPS